MSKRKFVMAAVATVFMFVAAVGMPAFGQNSNSSSNANMDSTMNDSMNSNQKTDKKSKSNKNGSKNSNTNSNVSTGMSGSTNGNTSGAGGSMAVSAADRKFMMTAAAGGLAEVAIAQVAVQKAASDAVKQYAQQMIDDHTKANEELMQIATSKGVTLPTAPDAKHQAMLTKMQAMSGADFDKAYIKNAGVADHMKMQKLFQSEASKGMDADTKAFAAKTLPAVQGHLRMAQDLSGTMMGTGGTKGKTSTGNSNGNSNSNP